MGWITARFLLLLRPSFLPRLSRPLATPSCSADRLDAREFCESDQVDGTRALTNRFGRVNIRVAVNQDTVHAHFSSERNELGQYLVNGQDRLQSALNASGLDLGRFQVDIDRQSAGRSFQQPASQEQSHGHAPQGESQNCRTGA